MFSPSLLSYYEKSLPEVMQIAKINNLVHSYFFKRFNCYRKQIKINMPESEHIRESLYVYMCCLTPSE